MSEVLSIYIIVLLLWQISITEDGAAANFTRSFAMKAGYYLCYSKVRGACAVKTPSCVCFSQQPLVPCACLSHDTFLCLPRRRPVGWWCPTSS